MLFIARRILRHTPSHLVCFLRSLALILRQLFYPRSLLFQPETIISMWMSKTTLTQEHFLDLLVSMGLKQHVNVPTHVSGHTLDLMITREHDLVISCVPVPTDISQIPPSVCVLLTAQILIVLQRLFVIVNSGQLVLMLYARMWKNPNFAQGNTVTLMSQRQLQFDTNISSGQACADEGESDC